MWDMIIESMVLGIILIVAALIGVNYGISKKNRTLVIVSVIALSLIDTIGLYFL